jgi:hypothetical protein
MRPGFCYEARLLYYQWSMSLLYMKTRPHVLCMLCMTLRPHMWSVCYVWSSGLICEVSVMYETRASCVKCLLYMKLGPHGLCLLCMTLRRHVLCLSCMTLRPHMWSVCYVWNSGFVCCVCYIWKSGLMGCVFYVFTYEAWVSYITDTNMRPECHT